MSRRFLILPILFGLIFCTIASADIRLVDSGKSDYSIVLPERPSPVEKTAATELQSYIEKSTGVKLPIVSEKNVTGDHLILIGATAEGQKLLGDTKLDALGYDAIVLKTFGPRIVLAGHKQRGTLYAVYTFLEEQLGVRWWTSKAELVPKNDNLMIRKLDTVYAPKIKIREAYYRDMHNPVFAPRSKCNGNSNPIRPEFGGHQRFNIFVHSFNQLLPPAKYFKDHPEWYSLLEGKRVSESGQLCLTNPEMRGELTRRVLERLRADPTAALISISQNDCYGQCECEKCREMVEAEGSESGPLLDCVNEVAAEVEKEFPDVLVETLAYQYTRKPPKTVRPRKNVLIRLCSIECSFVRPMEHEQNKKFRDDLEGWSAIAPQLYVWDYVTNFSSYHMPHPNLRVLDDNIRFYAKNNVIGMFEQGDSQSNVGDFIRMRAWVIAHLLWDPSLEADSLIDEFLAGYYGPAAPHLRRYLNILHDSAESSGEYLRCFLNRSNSFYTPKAIFEATAAFNRAEATVKDDPTLRMRVDRARISLDLIWIRRFAELKKVAKESGQSELIPKHPKAFCESVIARAGKYKIGNYRENRPFSHYESRLRRRLDPPAPLHELCKGLDSDDFVDLNEFEFLYNSYGKRCSLVKDPMASDGFAARMPCNHHQSAIGIPIEPTWFDGGKWRSYAIARIEKTKTNKTVTGPAMEMGVAYNDGSFEERFRPYINVNAEEAADGYKVYDMGAYELGRHWFLWFAPFDRPGEVEAVYIDRVIFVKEK
jgi:Domain of unknown function (DUF4838)/Glycosyl hydrolase family 67 N-terminus